jgi:hypothetical protein
VQEVMPLKRGETFGERHAEFHAFIERQCLFAFDDVSQRLRTIFVQSKIPVAELVIRKIHNRIEAPGFLHEFPHADKTLLRRDRSVQFRTAQFAFVAFFSDGIAAANLHGRSFTIRSLGEKNHTVRAMPDFPFKVPLTAICHTFIYN